MHRFAWFGALLASACGSVTDDRPPTLEYITEAILAPSCATAECHSAFKAQVGDVFDTPAATRRTIVGNELMVFPDDMLDPHNSFLIRSLTVGVPSLLDPAVSNVRMPYDAPMPDADIQLIERWIALGVPGAQCESNDQNRGCMARLVVDPTNPTRRITEYSVVECVDGNVIGAPITVCPGVEVCTFYTGNGRCVTP
jgi:hypothetical protein